MEYYDLILTAEGLKWYVLFMTGLTLLLTVRATYQTFKSGEGWSGLGKESRSFFLKWFPIALVVILFGVYKSAKMFGLLWLF